MRRLLLVFAVFFQIFALDVQSGSAPVVIDIIGNETLSLHQDIFDDDGKSCSKEHSLSASFPGFALPTNISSLRMQVEARIYCQQFGAVNVAHTLFRAGTLELLVECITPAFKLKHENAELAAFDAPMGLSGLDESISFSLSLRPEREESPMAFCWNGTLVAPTETISKHTLSQVSSSVPTLLDGGIKFGRWPGEHEVAVARVDFTHFVVAVNIAESAWACDSSARVLDAPQRQIVQLMATVQNPAGDLTVDQGVQFATYAKDAHGLPVRLKLTAFGVPPADCTQPACGDAEFFAFGPAGKAHLTASLRFPLPGRYTVRTEASNGVGLIATKDHTVTVYKLNDVYRKASCCRNTAFITAQQLGRPLHRTVFRDPATMQKAEQQLAWTQSYLYGADLEAERLFNYGVLAPMVNARPGASLLRRLTCQDAYLAGAGSPKLFGLQQADDVSGHNKAVMLVPLDFPWAAAADGECQHHWDNSDESACQVGCTKKNTQRLVSSTGMYDQFNQALIQSSYGALSLTPHPIVLPEVEVPREGLGASMETREAYYDVPARLAVSSQPQPQPWIHVTLTPYLYHPRPRFRAWSTGPLSRSFTVTRCAGLSLYWSLHEVAHRLGFRHVQLLKLPKAHVAPADPIDPELEVIDDTNYVQRLDVMSCCKSDYGIYHRNAAGWLQDSQKLVLGAQELSKQSTQRLVLWPFDRAESRGQLVTIALRRSASEIVLLGLRSASHWQDSGSGINDSPVQPDEVRENVQGIVGEYLLRRNGSWLSSPAMMDFNVLKSDWPHALPEEPGALSRSTAFSALKQGQSWFDAKTKLLVLFERFDNCDAAPGLPLYNHVANDFYGYRGEWPGTERYAKANYSGYVDLRCAHLTLITGANQPLGYLKAVVRVQNGSQSLLDFDEQTYKQETPSTRRLSMAVASRQNAATLYACSTADAFETALRPLTVDWSTTGAIVASIVVQDHLNRTMTTFGSPELHRGTTHVAIDLRATSLPVHLRILSLDGRHTLIEISKAQDGALFANYKYYDQISLGYETVALGHLTDRNSMQQHCLNAANPIPKEGEERQTRPINLALVLSGVAAVPMLLLVSCVLWVVRRKLKGEAEQRRLTRDYTRDSDVQVDKAEKPADQNDSLK